MITVCIFLFLLICTPINTTENLTKCSIEQKHFDEIIKNGTALDVFYFANETKETMQLTWAGENSGVLILVTMTNIDGGYLPSDVYRSENNGKTFDKITQNLGSSVYIRRENGLQRHQNQRDSKELFVICYDINDKKKSVIYFTNDGGATWRNSSVPFVLNGQLRFYPRKRLSPWILTLEESTYNLFLSEDNGNTWRNVQSNVVDFFWSLYEDDPEKTFYVLCRSASSTSKTNQHIFRKTIDFGRTWTTLMQNVVRVWAPRGVRTNIVDVLRSEIYTTDITTSRFLYVAHSTAENNKTIKLSVSTDGGLNFLPVFLPTIHQERFFSVLEVEDDSAFVHVDAPNDTGYGGLFTSDETGRVFTESLRQHLYPNHAPVTDFYRVASMRGTYLATKLNPDQTMHTVITHDRGASWRALGSPINVENNCKSDPLSTDPPTPLSSHSSTRFSKSNSGSIDSKGNTTPYGLETGIRNSLSVDLSAIKVCGLQISNQYSVKQSVIALPPLSIASAPGLILVHGHVATHLKNTPADVFVSSDGGYTWLKALDNPHHYQIANRGGLIVAVPANTLWPNVLRFSTDEGRCWHTIPLRQGVWTSSEQHFKSTLSPKHSTTDTPAPTATVTIHYQDTPPHQLNAVRNPLVTDVQMKRMLRNTANSVTVINDTHTTSGKSSASYSRTGNSDRENESVFFTGLVTEPGGRAMAAAVYGYGTSTQRWRVAVVDFGTNGMITRRCTEDDYETWIPHASTEGGQDGCLLGLRQMFRRRKKDSLCINEYGMNPLLNATNCPCTQADYECEYGYYRDVGSLECKPSSNVPPRIYNQSRFTSIYRRIPGNQCVGGWTAPLIIPQNKDGSTPFENSALLIVCIIIGIISVSIILALYVHRRSRGYSQNYFFHGSFPFDNRLRSWFTRNSWKQSNRMDQVGAGGYMYSASQSSLWPPYNNDNRWPNRLPNNFGVTVSNSTPFGRFSINSISNAATNLARMVPSNVGGLLHSNRGRSDLSNLIESEEVARTTTTPTASLGAETEVFRDPLSLHTKPNGNSIC